LFRCHYSFRKVGTHFGVRIQLLKTREVRVFG
jgi:glutamate/tyrosine decarboxylase-like PLP-dependent enzyme